MIDLTLNTILNVTEGRGINISDVELQIKSISLDSRKEMEKGLFIALIGEKFDAHDFVDAAIQQGAIALLLSHEVDQSIPQIIVPDTQIAMGKIAHWMRTQVKAQYVALTGSSGKTSVKEMTASILKQLGKTHYTKGNFNNNIGVPLTLFDLEQDDQYVVIELGANHKNEIRYMSEIVEPDVALINNISAAHLEGFGSLKGVSEAKSEIFLGLKKDGTAIINLDSYDPDWLSLLNNKKRVTFSLNQSSADYFAQKEPSSLMNGFKLQSPLGNINIDLPLMGQHNISNALAAAALSIAVGADLNAVKKGLEALTSVKGRLFPIKLTEQCLLIDDTYNANVGSMKAAIQVLKDQQGLTILIVGDMGELGQESVNLHREVGLAAKENHIDYVLSVGQLSRYISDESGVGIHFEHKSNIADWLNEHLNPDQNTTILIKGSRSSKMEELVEMILKSKG